MTRARSLISNQTLEILFAEPTQPTGPKRFPVMLKPIGGAWNEFVLGHVVTHLDIETWCAWKGYKLITLHAGARDAYSHERTDLF